MLLHSNCIRTVQVYAQHLGDQMRSRLVTTPRWPPDTPPLGTPSSTPSWATSARSPSSSSSPWSCYSHSPPSVTTASWQTKISGETKQIYSIVNVMFMSLSNQVSTEIGINAPGTLFVTCYCYIEVQ